VDFFKRNLLGLSSLGLTAFLCLFLPDSWPVVLIFALVTITGFFLQYQEHHDNLRKWRKMGANTWEEYLEKRRLAKINLDEANRVYHDWEYLKWCEPLNDDERILQGAFDGLLQIHNWDGMPRVKVRLNDDLETKHDRTAHYQGSFRHNRERGGQCIEYKPSHFRSHSPGVIMHVIKHEMVHAWIDWRGIQMNGDSHGPEFQRKLAEVS
jgi:hypothetical protein